MELSQQVTSLETSQKLKKLGVKQESLFYWTHATLCNGKEGLGKPFVQYAKKWNSHITNWAAFTSSELGEMLPYEWTTYKTPEGEYNSFDRMRDMQSPCEFTDTEAEARGKLLIYLLENNLI